MTDIFAGLICRPPRKEYSEADLGPARYLLQDQMCVRRDLELVTRRKLKIKCSQYLPVDSNTLQVAAPVPCVVYLHGNSGSRMDADDMVDTFLAEKISVFSIDFAGCGLSDGEYVTLGWREREDLEAVLDHLATMPETVSHVALYGRSMGAATAMLVASDDRFYHRICGMVLDSCYSSVRQVLLELANKYVGKVPLVPFSSMIEPAVDLLRQAVKQRAGFDIDKVNVLEAARHCNAPVLLGHAADDQLVLASHSRNLYAEYGGPKELNVFEGDHNSIRPQDFRDQALQFLQKCFADAQADERPRGPVPVHSPLTRPPPDQGHATGRSAEDPSSDDAQRESAKDGGRSSLFGSNSTTTAAPASSRDDGTQRPSSPSPPPFGAGVAASGAGGSGGEDAGGEWQERIHADDFMSAPKKVAETPRSTPEKAAVARKLRSSAPQSLSTARPDLEPRPASPQAAAPVAAAANTPSASRAAPLADDVAAVGGRGGAGRGGDDAMLQAVPKESREAGAEGVREQDDDNS
jgi:alpha-beta hydrolase superfamily lysophospholipase